MSGSPLFALVISGRPLDTNFQAVDSNKMMAQILQPAAVQEFTICLLQPALPPDQGIAVYYTIPNHSELSGWQYIGPVSLTHPTASFRAPWYNKIDPHIPVVQLGLAVESAALLSTLQSINQNESDLALDSAKGIAKHLYDFMSSYAHSGKVTGHADALIVPTDCIDRWYKKFEDKHRREPFFWLKKDLTAK